MKRAAAQVGAASALGGVVGYVAQFLAARWLGPVDYATFAVFWAILFIVVLSLSGIAQEVIRISRLTKLRDDSGASADFGETQNPRMALVAIATGALVSLVVLFTGLLWAPMAFGDNWLFSIVLLSLSTLLVSSGLTVGGTVAGFARWRTYSLLVALEAISRLVLFVVAAMVMPNVLGFSIAAALSFLPNVLVAILWGPLRRESFSLRSDTPVLESTTRVLRAIVASGLSGVLIIGWPALLLAAAAVNPRGSTPVTLGILILVVTLTRAPLMVPLTSFQNALIARFTGLDLSSRRKWVAMGAGIIVLVSVLLAGLAALLGPPLLPLIFGDEYQAGATIMAALTAATAGLGIIMLTGVAAITAARHSLYLFGWATAIAVALIVLFFVPLTLEWATVLALVMGPMAGAIVQLGALRSPSRPF